MQKIKQQHNEEIKKLQDHIKNLEKTKGKEQMIKENQRLLDSNAEQETKSRNCRRRSSRIAKRESYSSEQKARTRT